MAACSAMLELISQYVDNTIEDESERMRLEAHIAACPACKEELDALTALKALLSDLPELELPEGFHEQMMAAVHSAAQESSVLPITAKRRSFFTDLNWRSYATAAAGVVLAVVGLGAVSTASRAMLPNNSNASQAPYAATAAPKANMVASAESDAAGESLIENNMRIMADSTVSDVYVETQAFNISYASVPIDNIVRQYNLTITPSDFDEAVRLIKEASGVLLDSYINYYDETSWYGAYRDGSFTKSIPSTDFETVLAVFRNLGEIEQENQSQYTVTYGIADAQARLSAKQVEYDRLILLLEKTTDVKSMLMVDNRIQQVIREMDGYQGMLKNYNSNIAQSIVTLTLKEEAQKVVIKVEPVTFLTNLKNAFTSSVNGTAAFLEWSLISFAGAFLPLLVLAIVLFIIFIIIQKFVRRRQR